MNNTRSRVNTGITLFLFLLGVSLIIFSVKQDFDAQKREEGLVQKISDKVAQEVATKVEERTTVAKPSEFPDFDSLNRLNELPVITDFDSWTPNAPRVDDSSVKKVVILKKGTLSKAYVYIRASLDDRALTKWESIYIKMDNAGGHLLRSQSLRVPQSNKTELLYALDTIPCLVSLPYSDSGKHFYVDWFELLNSKSKVNVLAFISSLRPAKIEKISFYYECDDGEECLLELEN